MLEYSIEMSDRMDNLLEEIQNKMNKLLDTDINICQHYSAIVIVLYKKILAHLNGQMDINCFRDDINELIDYIDKENEAFKKLLSYDRNTLLPKINFHINQEDGPPEYLRFVNKLRFIRNIYNGLKITTNKLDINKVTSDMEFDIYSAIFSLIYIEIFRKILNKLETVTYDNEQDEMFVNNLFEELNFKIIYRCSCNDLFEIISLYCDMDINKFPNIKMDVLKTHLSNIYQDDNDIDEHINEILYNSIIDDINQMTLKNNLDNNPEAVFDYLYFVTKMDVILSYLNKKYLEKLLNYYNQTQFNNNFIKYNTRKLIRSKLDN